MSDLDNPPNAHILNTSVYPKGFPSEFTANGCCVICQNPDSNVYTAQLAFCFGSDKIAIRRKNGTDTWSEWKYFTAS